MLDDGLTGAGSVREAIQLRRELQQAFKLEGFTLRKWKAKVREKFSPAYAQDLSDPEGNQNIYYQDEYTKVLGMEWNMALDCFHPMIPTFDFDKTLTKKILVSNIARLYDVLRWYSDEDLTLKVVGE